VVIKSSDILNMLDEQSIDYLSFEDLNALCVLASLDLQLDIENESSSSRRNLC